MFISRLPSHLLTIYYVVSWDISPLDFASDQTGPHRLPRGGGQQPEILYAPMREARQRGRATCIAGSDLTKDTTVRGSEAASFQISPGNTICHP